MALGAADVDEDEAVAGILDARRERLRRLEQRLLRRPLALGVAAAGDELRQDRARLREGLPGVDAVLPRTPRRREDVRRAAVSLHDGRGLGEELRLAPQPRREREERDEKAGDASHG